MKMKTGFRRLMSMLMCFVMVAGMVPASALATETSPAEIPTAVVESAAPEVPAADALVIEEPVGEAPAEEPADETPAEEPANETPAEEPADETPAEEPADETPAEEPADETPAEEPSDETPAEEPADETPAEESPAEEPVVEAAAEEPAEEDTVEEAAEEAETEEANPVQELFDTLMAFETYEALGDYMDNMTEEQYELLAQFTEEQNAALREKIAALQENEVEILDHTFNHLDVRIQNVPLTLTKKVINMVTGVTVSTSTSEITANLTKVEYVTINGVTYSNFNKMDSREWRQSNVAINLSALTESSTAVLVVDLVDTNGNTYDDVRITYNRAGIQYAIEHCDGYRNGQYDGIDFDPAQGANNITLVEYDDYVIPVMKIWEDDNDRDRIRPASVTVNLYANGVLNDSVVLSDDNGWQHTFTGKPSHDDAGNSIAYTIDEEDVSDVYTKTVGNNGTHLTVTNSYTPETVDITANKVWEDNDDSLGKRPASVSFQLYGNGSAVGEPVELNEAGGWTHTWTGLPKNSAGTEINYTVGETSAPEGYEHSVSGYTITNKYVDNDPFNQMYGRVTITGQKIWDDNGDEAGRPDSITVHLLADGKKVATQTVTGPNWTWSFDISNGIPGTGESPVGVEFTVEEDTVLNYVLSDTKNPIVVFNDPSAGAGWTETKPCSSLAIRSAQDAKSIVVAKKGNNYVCWSWDALASFERALIVESVAAATGFSSDISNYTFISGVGNQSEFGMTVTETEVQFGKTSQWSWFAHGTYNRGSADSTASSLTNSLSNLTISGTKVWEDANDQDGIRPETVTINLLANGVKIDSVAVAEGAWEFTGLKEYQNGEKIEYTITENAVDGYTSEITGDAETGFTVTNTHEPEQTEVSVTKVWEDNDDQDGFRPDGITINLLANGEEAGSVELNKDNQWKHTFTELDKYAAGVEITYTVQEVEVTDYTTEITGDAETGFTVTNTHTPEQTEVSVTKVWEDNDNQDGFRPASVTINLLANGENAGSVELNEANQWKHTFTELDKYAAGAEITYTVQEVEVTDYTTKITGDAATGFTVTNTHIPVKIEIEVTKVWEDNDNQDGFRPESITVHLFADGVDTEKTLTLTAEGDWKDSFTDLDKYANGREIVYTVTEDDVPEYEGSVDGFIITNTHEIVKTQVSVTKVWEDNDDQDGFRPDSITINLLANGEEAGSVELNEANQWKHTFTELDKYAEGVEITYTVQEVEVDEYTTEITGDAATGFTVTNTHTPVEMKINGNKYWEDGNNQDGIRPASITIRLFANGTEVDSRTVTEEDEWKWSFEELPKFSEGKEIVYTIVEDAVDGYESRVEGFDVINTHVPAEIDITVVKAWADDKNEGETRPEKVTILLYANGEDTGKRLVLTENSGWVGRFYDLPVYADGEPIEYTIDEAAVEGYNAVIRGSAESGFTVTNSLKDIPSTGDERTPMLWIGLMLASMLSFAWAVLPVGKKRRQ